MDKQLLAMLVCPVCKGKLKYDNQAQEMICTFDGLGFPIQDGVPVMLEGEARRLSAEEKIDRADGSDHKAEAES